jgi:phospholipid/cholesterol/gamma-HCH transport system permease protein
MAIAHRPTEQFPIVQRTSIRFFRRMSVKARSALEQIGRRAIFSREIVRGFATPSDYLAETMRQMRVIGVDSVPLTVMVAAFIGAVISMQVRYQLFAGVELSLVGLAARMMIVLELGPLLTGLVLTGRVGARMTAEIGTMRVTEQIDALETLSYDPVAYLIVPRLIAATVMLPILVILADAVGIMSGYLVGTLATDIPPAEYQEGLRLAFAPFQIVYSLLKATMFGAAIALVCSYEGYVTGAGAEGVGRSTARAVVIASVTILVLDALTAAILAPFLQA